MNLSLDYDNTYTRDKKFWNDFITISKMNGHIVYCVTMRDVKEGWEVLEDLEQQLGKDNIIFTSRQAKEKFCFDRHISIDVWIDDMPFFILNNG